MQILFVHQNFPAQFRYLAPRLAGGCGWKCSFVTRNTKAAELPGVERIPYRLRTGPSRANHFCTRAFEGNRKRDSNRKRDIPNAVHLGRPPHWSGCFFISALGSTILR